jgi:hypothetical protein
MGYDKKIKKQFQHRFAQIQILENHQSKFYKGKLLLEFFFPKNSIS